MNYRYNYSVHFFQQNHNVIIISGNNKTTISGNNTLYDFLIYCISNIIISYENIKYYNISLNMLDFLLQLEVLIDINAYQSGQESLELHQRSYNPNRFSATIDNTDVINAVGDNKNRLFSIISRSIFDSYDTIFFDKITDINDDNLIPIRIGSCSKRTNIVYLGLDINYLLSSLKFICTDKNNHRLYASGGAMYSVFHVVITNNDIVLVTDHHNKVIYKTSIKGIYIDSCSVVLGNHDYDPQSYGAIILLISDTLPVFRKYSNRGYRFIMMETGALGLLRRTLYAERGYLELGGYFDQKLWDIIIRHRIFNDVRHLIITHFILLYY